MYSPHEPYDSDAYIQTTAGVKVSRDAVLCGAQFVEMPGGKVLSSFLFVLLLTYTEHNKIWCCHSR